MIQPPSVLRDYDLIDTTDDAIVQPEPPPEPARLDDESDLAWEERRAKWADDAAKVATAWREQYDRACETGDWSALLVPGKVPTLFHVRPIGVTAWTDFRHAVREMVWEQSAQLAFRLGVTGISNLNLGIKIERRPYVGPDGTAYPSFGDVLTAAVVDRIGAGPGGGDVVKRIGFAIARQRGAPLGKS